MIIGRDLMTKLKMKIDFEFQCVRWGEAEVPMCNPRVTEKEFYAQDSEIATEAMSRIKRILDAKYEAADLKEVVADCTHLSK